MAQEATYRYGPLERGGVMLGLRVSQLVGFVLAGLIGLGFMQQANITGLLLAIATIAAAAAILLIPLRGHTIEEWTPLGGKARGRPH
jgi:formate-dependent nitrite reductase membrane component NrfD